MLAGRKVESARLAAALASARSGAGGALLLVGDPGIGKTTLLRALVDVLTPLLHHLDALPEA